MIRRLTARDAARYRALRLRALRGAPDSFLSTHARESRHDPATTRRRLRENHVLGAFVGGALAGMVGIRRERNPKIRHKALVWGVFVAPDHRRSGLGRALMIEALRRVRAMRGVEQVRLDVGTWNRAARGLYRSVGFRGFGIERRSMRVGGRWIDEEMMVLFLR